MRRTILALSFLLLSLSAHASYMESCALNGMVLNKPQQYRVYLMNDEGQQVERVETRFRYKVTRAHPNGRADSGCKHLTGQKLNVALDEPVANVHLRLRRWLKLNYNAMNDRGHPDTITRFTLRKP